MSNGLREGAIDNYRNSTQERRQRNEEGWISETRELFEKRFGSHPGVQYSIHKCHGRQPYVLIELEDGMVLWYGLSPKEGFRLQKRWLGIVTIWSKSFNNLEGLGHQLDDFEGGDPCWSCPCAKWSCPWSRDKGDSGGGVMSEGAI